MSDLPPKEELIRFHDKVWIEGARHARPHLPWRGISDAYAVYVSEVMLQQTQVKRVLSFWPRFLEAFPTISDLAQAESSSVLTLWQGLGYNRRALALHKSAQECVARFGGCLPYTVEELQTLPGIGPATAAGIVSFAYQKPSIYIETNVRTVFIQEWFPETETPIHDRQLIPLVEATCSQDDPRGWYYALLDWGAHIKQRGGNPSRQSAHYTKQSTFEGSHRQKRSFVLKTVLAAERGIMVSDVREMLNKTERSEQRPELSPERFDAIIEELTQEGFFTRDGEILRA